MGSEKSSNLELMNGKIDQRKSRKTVSVEKVQLHREKEAKMVTERKQWEIHQLFFFPYRKYSAKLLLQD